MQGGAPDLKIEWYEDLFAPSSSASAFTHCLSAPEVTNIAGQRAFVATPSRG
jgi:hypothetical protein